MYLNSKAIIATLTVGMAFLSHSSSFVDATETTKLILASVEEESVPETWFVGLKEVTGVPDDTSNYRKNLKGDFVQSETQLRDLVSAYGGKLERMFIDATYGMEVTMDQETAASIAENPSVAYVEQVTIFRTSQQFNPTWGIDRIDQRDLPLDDTYNPGANDGTGVTAYIIDTGVRITHDEFKNASGQSRVIWGTNTSGDNVDTDCDGHGTHVAGTVGGLQYGVAKNVNIVAVKVFDCSGNGGPWSNIIAGVEWVMNHAENNGISDKAVANMSLGGGFVSTVNTAVKNLHNSGVLTAVAAGNSNDDACFYSPASVPVVITVGSTTSNDERSGFSNHGPCLDIFAPGSLITSAWFSNDSITNTISGTSMASPHVAGALALAISGNSSDAVGDIINAATPDKVKDPRNGSPNLLLYTSNTTVATCVDSTLKFKFEKPNGKLISNYKDCSWVSLDKVDRCGVKGNRRTCPATCNKCQVCKDSPFKFKIVKPNKTLKKDCKWVKEKLSRCGTPGVAEACRYTCAVC